MTSPVPFERNCLNMPIVLITGALTRTVDGGKSAG